MQSASFCHVLFSRKACIVRENPYKVYGSEMAGITLLSVHVLGKNTVFIKCIHSKTEILLLGVDLFVCLVLNDASTLVGH